MYVSFLYNDILLQWRSFGDEEWQTIGKYNARNKGASSSGASTHCLAMFRIEGTGCRIRLSSSPFVLLFRAFASEKPLHAEYRVHSPDCHSSLHVDPPCRADTPAKHMESPHSSRNADGSYF